MAALPFGGGEAHLPDPVLRSGLLPVLMPYAVPGAAPERPAQERTPGPEAAAIETALSAAGGRIAGMLEVESGAPGAPPLDEGLTGTPNPEPLPAVSGETTARVSVLWRQEALETAMAETEAREDRQIDREEVARAALRAVDLRRAEEAAAAGEFAENLEGLRVVALQAQRVDLVAQARSRGETIAELVEEARADRAEATAPVRLADLLEEVQAAHPDLAAAPAYGGVLAGEALPLPGTAPLAVEDTPPPGEDLPPLRPGRFEATAGAAAERGSPSAEGAGTNPLAAPPDPLNAATAALNQALLRARETPTPGRSLLPDTPAPDEVAEARALPRLSSLGATPGGMDGDDGRTTPGEPAMPPPASRTPLGEVENGEAAGQVLDLSV